jgi:allantoinase
MPTLPRERADYSAIVDRPPLKLPGGARIVFWSIVNLEVWDIGKPMARQVLPAPTGQPMLPDVPNWSWHEYGMRVGVWRFFDLFARLAMIARSMGILESFTGKRPVGWLGPGLTETYETPELLAAAGVKYIGDWVYDDEPTVIRTDNGPLVTLPYSVELNDIPMMIVQHHESDYLLKRTIDQFDRLYAEGADRAKIISLAIHPYISGQPHRIKYLEQIYDYVARHDGVLHWNGEQILDWYRAQTSATQKAAE